MSARKLAAWSADYMESNAAPASDLRFRLAQQWRARL